VVVDRYDGAQMHIYIDGRLVHSAPFGSVGSPVDVTVLLGASQQDSVAQWFYNGVMAEVRLWSVARTADEIADSRKHWLTCNEEKLLAYWPMMGRSQENTREQAQLSLHDHALKNLPVQHHGIRYRARACNADTLTHSLSFHSVR
jgi:hypothetical protein